MRFTLVTFGSEGDTRPFVALGRGLQDAGHEVLLFGEQSSLARARDCNVPCQPLAGDVKTVLPVIEPGQDVTLKVVFKSIRDIKSLVNDHTEFWLKGIAAHARSSDAVLYSGLAYCHGEAVAQALGKPGIALALQPFAATREFSSWALPPMHLPRWMNRISYGWSLMRVLRLAFGKKVSELRGNILGSSSVTTDPSGFLTLYGISRHLIEPPEDWPSSHRICGPWSLEPSQYRPSLGLERFFGGRGSAVVCRVGDCLEFSRTSVAHDHRVGGGRTPRPILPRMEPDRFKPAAR